MSRQEPFFWPDSNQLLHEQRLLEIEERRRAARRKSADVRSTAEWAGMFLLAAAVFAAVVVAMWIMTGQSLPPA